MWCWVSTYTHAWPGISIPGVSVDTRLEGVGGEGIE
jgi:hypothetical protein